MKQQLENLDECPFCQSKSFDHFMCGYDFLTNFGEFTVVRCSNCRLVFTNPRPSFDSMEIYYPGSKYQSHKQNKSAIFDRLYFFAQAAMLKRKLAIIKKYAKPEASLLDVGCGVGQFANFMGTKGYDVAGVEPNLQARTQAQKKGLKVFETLPEYISAIKQRPQVISLWHVLEHQHNYFQSLNEYQKILDFNGFLIIAVPQFESFDARFYKSNWAGYDLPRHLFHFNENTLAESAKNAGFELVDSKGMPFDSFYISFLSEKSKKSRIALFRAPLIGFVSNLMAVLGIRPWSSQFFIFKKT